MNKHHAAHYLIAAVIIAAVIVLGLKLNTEQTAIDRVDAGPTHMGFAPAQEK